MVTTRYIVNLYQVETKKLMKLFKIIWKNFLLNIYLDYQKLNIIFLKSKISTSKGGSRKGHTAFTEQGVYMLATILKSKVATEVSIRIMDTFVKMRHYINLNGNLLPNRVLLLEEKVDNNTKRIDEILKRKYEFQYNNVCFIIIIYFTIDLLL